MKEMYSKGDEDADQKNRERVVAILNRDLTKEPKKRGK